MINDAIPQCAEASAPISRRRAVRWPRGSMWGALSALLAFAAAWPLAVAAPVTSTFTYQGQLKVAGVPANGQYDFNFVLCTDPVANVAVGAIQNFNDLPIANGLLTVPLSLGSAPANSGERLWLSIQIRDGASTGAYTELLPRPEVTAQIYSQHALEAELALVAGPDSVNAGSIVDGSVTGTDIATATVTSANIQNGAVTTLDIADGTVGSADLAASSVTSAKIAGSAVTAQEVDASSVQLRVSGSCAVGSSIRVINSNGSVSCETDDGGGSAFWSLGGNAGTLPSTHYIGTSDNVPLVLRANNERVARFDPASNLVVGFVGPNVLLGHISNNVATGVTAGTIGGGGGRNASASLVPNLVTDFAGTVAGGQDNLAGGDDGNVQSQAYASVGGGLGNHAANAYATVAGGRDNSASGNGAVVPGGIANSAVGSTSFAAGNRAKANHNGSFVFADSASADFASTAANQFIIRAGGGVGINASEGPMAIVPNFVAGLTIRPFSTNGASNIQLLSDVGDAYRGFDLAGKDNGIFVLSGLHADAVGEAPVSVSLLRANFFAAQNYAKFAFNRDTDPDSGAVLQFGNAAAPGNGASLSAGGTWTNGSSRTFKTDFAAVDAGAILDRVLALPITTWHYRNSEEGRHLGPMAEDFAAAFGLGADAQHIATVDADGVALAAIQGLNAKLEAENRALRSRLERLEALLLPADDDHRGERHAR